MAKRRTSKKKAAVKADVTEGEVKPVVTEDSKNETDIEETILDAKESVDSSKGTEESPAPEVVKVETEVEVEKPNPDIAGFVSKAKRGGFKKGEFERLVKSYFEGFETKVKWTSSRQCKVTVDGTEIDRVFIGNAV